MSAVRKEEEEEVAPGAGLEVSDGEIEAVLQEASGDPRQAIRMLLQDLGTRALDADAAAYLGASFAVGCLRERGVGLMKARGFYRWATQPPPLEVLT